MADVLNIAKKVLPEGQDLDIEIEYEDVTISQYPVTGYTVTAEAVTLNSRLQAYGLPGKRCVPANAADGAGKRGRGLLRAGLLLRREGENTL